MKQYILLALLACAALLTGCSKDEETAVTDHCYISGVTLGTLKRVLHTTTAEGTDSIVRSTYTGNNFAMTVNQRTLVIENRDSLLYGTDVSAVLMTIEYVGATLAWRPASDEDSEWIAYDSTDSLDLREPLHIFALSRDGNSYRTYTLRLNVHKQEGDSLSWRQMENTEALAQMSDRKAAVVGDELMVWGHTADNIQLATRSINETKAEWKLDATNLPLDTYVESIMQHGETLYAGTEEGVIYTSADGRDWTSMAPATEGLRLAAVTDSLVYAVIGQKLCSSADGQTWTEESLDASAEYLPTTHLRSCVIQQPNGTHRLVLMGYRENDSDTTAVVWNKMWNDVQDESDDEWMYLCPTPDNTHQMPRLEQLCLLSYDGRCLALGGASETGRGRHTSLDAMYFSNDYGITWKPSYELFLPTAVKGVSGLLTAAVDGNNYIWLIADNQVWRGRINRLGFVRQ